MSDDTSMATSILSSKISKATNVASSLVDIVWLTVQLGSVSAPLRGLVFIPSISSTVLILSGSE